MASGTSCTPKSNLRRSATSPIRTKFAAIKNSLLNRSVNITPYRAKRGYGNYFFLENGNEIYDASGGAAVSSLGRRNKRVEEAMAKIQRQGLSYVASIGFDTDVTAYLADYLIASTGEKLKKAVFYCSGSEASEAALKLVTQYFGKEKVPTEPNRTLIIARERSYHGATLGALDLSGHEARKALYDKILPKNMRLIPACNPYRNRKSGQSDEEYVQWHRQVLVSRIEESDNKIASVIIEPVVGAALGCAPAVPGYLEMIREVCDQHDILLIFDEIMCGMGRTGYLHAWQETGVVPDIQLIGKALGAGFQPISAMLVGPKIIDALEKGPSNGAFIHGHTFQNYPLAAAAALEVQKIIQDDRLLHNVKEKGPLLEKKLRARLESHRYVGNIRGPPQGLFLGIEFVKDKETKTPFDANESIYMRIYKMGLKSYNIHIYPGAGCFDGFSGDHVMISPAFNITEGEVNLIVDRVGRLIEDFFDEYDRS